MKEFLCEHGSRPDCGHRSDDAVFSIIYNYRELVYRKRRRVLRKMNDLRKRSQRISTQQIQEPSQPLFQLVQYERYDQQEPWDVLVEDSVDAKLQRSSTNNLSELADLDRSDVTLTFSDNTIIGKTSQSQIFCPSFVPFEYK